MEDIFAKLQDHIQKLFHQESTGHDFTHLQRVFNLCLHIQEKEGGDRLVIGIAALVHDVHRLMRKEQGKYCSPLESLPQVKEILNVVEIPEDIQQKVLHCVEFHEEYGFTKEGKTTNNLETLILQDADNLDAIGAIGIGRALLFDGAHGVPMWNPDIPLEDTHYQNEKHDPSTLHHFHNKLLKLGENMNTKTGKALAQARHHFVEVFIEQFFKEWSGER